MKFADLLKTGIPFSLAVSLQYEQLKVTNNFWDSLSLDQWLQIYFCADVPPEARDKAIDEIKKRASAFSDMLRITRRSGRETPLKEWALQQMKEKASTFYDYLEVSRQEGKYDFEKLFALAIGFDDLLIFCGLVVNYMKEVGGRGRLICAAVEKMSVLEGIECEKWIGAYVRSSADEVRQLARNKIQEFDFPTKKWISFCRLFPTETLMRFMKEKALASARSLSDYKAIYEYFYDKEVFEKILELAETIKELDWLASRNNHKEPLAGQIIEKMTQVATTFDEWKQVYFYCSNQDNPWRAKVLARMKELAAV